MAQISMLFIGINGIVLALDRATGQEVWRSKLKGSQFVNVALDGGELYATTLGEIFRLDPETGHVRWNNKLSGLGRGLVTMATAASQQAITSHEVQRRNEEAAAPGTVAAV